MEIDPKALLTVSFTLFAVIDILGAVPILISLKEKMGGIPGRYKIQGMGAFSRR